MVTKTELGQNHKEKTDTHRILLAVNASEHGARLDVIVTDDTDVFVLAITFSKNYHTTFPGVLWQELYNYLYVGIYKIGLVHGRYIL